MFRARADGCTAERRERLLNLRKLALQRVNPADQLRRFRLHLFSQVPGAHEGRDREHGYTNQKECADQNEECRAGFHI